LGDTPLRTPLKETISLITLFAFFGMMFQFYLSRANKAVLTNWKMGRIIKWHKVLGYIIIGILLIHPALIVVPRYFEAGVAPSDALTLILTTGSKGIITGLIAWGLMVMLGITSLLRKKLHLSYKSWRVFHGILSIVFIILASFHVIETGRHISTPMAGLIALLAGTGILLLLKTYLFNPMQKPAACTNDDESM
jgi:predicted ferric reductase